MEKLTMKNTSGFTQRELNIINEANKTLDENFDNIDRVFSTKKKWKDAGELIDAFYAYDFSK